MINVELRKFKKSKISPEKENPPVKQVPINNSIAKETKISTVF